MKEITFMGEPVTKNDLFFICYMIERVARKLHQPNCYVVNSIGEKELYKQICDAPVLHCENPLKIESEWINNYNLKQGNFIISDVDKDLCEKIPSETSIGKVYMRLITDTLLPDEDYIQGLIRIYNDSICKTIDNYNSSAYYEPSYFIARAYFNGGF